MNIADKEHLDEELQTLRQVWAQNGFDSREVDWALLWRKKEPSGQVEDEEESTRGVVVVSFCGTVTNRLTRLLWRKNIRVIARSPLKIKQCMHILKDSLGLNAPGVYNIPYSWGHSYIEQTVRTVVIREAEKKHYLPLGNIDKSAVVLHRWNIGHMINFKETTII